MKRGGDAERMPADGQTHRALDDARLVARMWMEMRKREAG
jgi:inhibitor of KinA sporulation pathway (predicted exonuclease)